MPSTKEYRARYRKTEHGKEMRRKHKARHRLNIKLRAYNIISNNNIKCAYCECDDIKLLEINHKNGGGSKEYEKRPARIDFYNDITKGIRKADDLELTCRVCNARHYLELVNGPLPYKIQWEAPPQYPQQLLLELGTKSQN